VETINIEGIRQCVELSETILEELTTKEQKPVFVRAAPAAANPNRGGPRLGVMPNYNDDQEGVLLDDVTPGGVADKGGLKKGDRIVALNGKPVQNVQSYMTLMSGMKRGEKLEVTVVRGGMTLKLTLTLE
jgi:S1-C subfamily serine protease